MNLQQAKTLRTIEQLKDAKFCTPEWKELETVIQVKRKLCEAYGIGTDINTPDGIGHILTIHGRAVSVSLNTVNTTQILHGHSEELGAPLHRTYLFKDFDCPLLLRTVDQLTDEEIITVANMYGWNRKDLSKDQYAERLLQYRVDLPCICLPGYYHRHMKFLFDYLTRIGIILPFTYLNDQNQPITLQPDEVIALGWAKIKITHIPGDNEAGI